ncbi:MAG: hypothetical protein HZB84_04025 [Deltaproteobacteria bacterium]|nr:hypothetical protein [Deltaproteobacteria bacterium]
MKRKWLYYGIMALSLAVMPVRSKALAADNYWLCGSDQWDNGSCWSLGAQPGAGDNALLNAPGATVDYVSASNPTLGYVEVDESLYGSSLNQTQDTLTTDYMTVGNVGYGGYNLSGTGSLVVNNNLTVGASTGSFGAVVQSGGSVSISGGYGALTLGRDAGAYGQYELWGGTLTLVGSEEYIGENGAGYFYQNDGTHELNGVMYLGVQATGYGYYELLNGTLTAGAGGGSIVLGEWGGTGVFNQSGGTVAVNDITLGRQTGANGTYNLSYGDVTVSGNTIVGDYGTGTFNQSAGTNTTGSLVLGQNVGGTGTYNLTGGTLNDSAIVGDAGVGIFNNSGGTHNVTNDEDLILGNQSTGVGTYNLSGSGILSVNMGNTIVGKQHGRSLSCQRVGLNRHL